MSQVNWTQTVLKGPKSEHNTKVMSKLFSLLDGFRSRLVLGMNVSK